MALDRRICRRRVPNKGHVKINVDSSWFPNSSDGGIGYVIWKDDGYCCLAVPVYLHAQSVLFTELQAINYTLSYLYSST